MGSGGGGGGGELGEGLMGGLLWVGCSFSRVVEVEGVSSSKELKITLGEPYKVRRELPLWLLK